MAQLLSNSELRALDRLRLLPRRAFTGSVRGERLTSRRGVSIDFADYRSYSEGDDLRHLDWNVLARLGHAVTKTYRDEEDLCVHLLLDDSSSMNFGEPSKVSRARQLAWTFGYMALCGGDTVYPRMISSARQSLPLRGRTSLSRLSHWVAAGSDEPSRELSHVVESFARSNARTGMVVLVSDGMDERLPTIMPALSARGHDFLFLQILSRIEIDPDLEGDLRLVDSETRAAVELTANSNALTEYRRRFAQHQNELQSSCERSGGRFLTIYSEEELASSILQKLKRYGWVKS